MNNVKSVFIEIILCSPIFSRFSSIFIKFVSFLTVLYPLFVWQSVTSNNEQHGRKIKINFDEKNYSSISF